VCLRQLFNSITSYVNGDPELVAGFEWSTKSVKEKYKDDLIAATYASDLEDFLLSPTICFKTGQYFVLYSNNLYFCSKIELKIYMSIKLSQKQIGQRIAELRKLKGLSQEDLAKSVKISRPSLAQIELGNRSLDIFELQALSVALSFSLDDFVSEDFTVKQELEADTKAQPQKMQERISVPKMQIEKFKNVLIYILERCAGKPNVGETVLYKLLYFSDFNYYEIYEEHLTGARYRKLPYGPVPQKLDSIINQMIDAAQLQRVKTEYHGFSQTRYLPLVKPDLTQLKASEKEVIDKVIDHMSDWSASTISNYSHKDMPWMASKEGEDIDYELAFYREAPYSVRNYGEETEEL
jgi:transcriptional regulator with XRE-family HTH domain